MGNEVSVTALAAELNAGRSLVLLDVREADELALCALDGVVHIPVDEVEERLGELDPSSDIVVVCRSGARSRRITHLLQGKGFASVRNMTGGMNAWATEVDPSLPTY